MWKLNIDNMYCYVYDFYQGKIKARERGAVDSTPFEDRFMGAQEYNSSPREIRE